MKLLRLAAAALCVFGGSAAVAADISVFSAGAVEPGLIKVADQFRRETGHEVKIQFGTAPQLAKRLAAGEAADILIAPPAVVDEQVKNGKLIAEGRVTVGRVGVGVAVRNGMAPPDIASVDALKRALLNADSVVYNQASTGIYLEKLFDKLGVAEQVKPKATRYANGAQVFEHVINGKGNELGFGAITEIKTFEAKGLKLVGPLPAEVQNYTTYTAAVMTGAQAADVAREFVRYLGTGAAKGAFAAAGID